MNGSTRKLKKKQKKIHENNDNENMTVQILWDAATAVMGGKYIAIQAHLKKQEKSQICNLTLHLKELEKEQVKPKANKRREIIKIIAEINGIETTTIKQ